VAGNSVEAELKRRILVPLRLDETSLDTKRQMAGRHVHGYYRHGNQLVDTTLLTPSWAWAAGAMVSTVDDVSKFYRALARGEVVRPEQLREMRTSTRCRSPGGSATRSTASRRRRTAVNDSV
jgi:D-alanyl-D-alanine carboxypeptidase